MDFARVAELADPSGCSQPDGSVRQVNLDIQYYGTYILLLVGGFDEWPS